MWFSRGRAVAGRVVWSAPPPGFRIGSRFPVKLAAAWIRMSIHTDAFPGRPARCPRDPHRDQIPAGCAASIRAGSFRDLRVACSLRGPLDRVGVGVSCLLTNKSTSGHVCVDARVEDGCHLVAVPGWFTRDGASFGSRDLWRRGREVGMNGSSVSPVATQDCTSPGKPCRPTVE